MQRLLEFNVLGDHPKQLFHFTNEEAATQINKTTCPKYVDFSAAQHEWVG